jgi:hypothetical protein
MALPVRFAGGTGITRDLSAGGLFFLTDTPFEVGQPVELSVALAHADPDRPTELACRGNVTRVERPGPGQAGDPMFGVAVAAEDFAFTS